MAKNQPDKLLRDFLEKSTHICQETLADFIFTEEEEKAWFQSGHDFAKQIATPLPTKRRRRVTLREVT